MSAIPAIGLVDRDRRLDARWASLFNLQILQIYHTVGNRGGSWMALDGQKHLSLHWNKYGAVWIKAGTVHTGHGWASWSEWALNDDNRSLARHLLLMAQSDTEAMEIHIALEKGLRTVRRRYNNQAPQPARRRGANIPSAANMPEDLPAFLDGEIALRTFAL